MKIILLRFDAPLVSFGAPMVDKHGVVQHFPALSMLVGILGNALGWDHRDAAKLEGLQDRLSYAGRIDRLGEALVDYQTVDLGLPWMDPEQAGWTTRGRIAERGGASDKDTHIRYRHYRADSLHVIAIALTGERPPTVEAVASALEQPARPLFIGRKCCLPSAPLLLRVVEAISPIAALSAEPRSPRGDPGHLPAWWFDGADATGAIGESRVVPVTDERDWLNQIHGGRRLMREGLVNPPEATGG